MPKRKDKNLSPVFRLKPINRGNEAIIKYKGYITENEKLGDEIVELDKILHEDYEIYGKHAIPIQKIGMYDMIGRVYHCNIVGSYIVVGSRYPLMYLNVGYDRPLVSGSLFQIFLSIDMDPEVKERMKKISKGEDEKDRSKDTDSSGDEKKNKKKKTKKPNNAHYVNLRFKGKWVLHSDFDDELVEHFDELMRKRLEDDASIEFYKNMTPEKDAMEDEDIINWVDEYVKTKMEYYKAFFDDQAFDFVNFTHARDYFINLCNSEDFHKFIQVAMKCRDIYRRKEAGIENDEPGYKVPEKVVNLSNAAQDMINNNELILED